MTGTIPLLPFRRVLAAPTRMPLTLVNTLTLNNNHLESDRKAHLRFDINADRGITPVYFTSAQLDQQAGEQLNVHEHCTECHLPVSLWGLGFYLVDNDGAIYPGSQKCKACWVYAAENTFVRMGPAPAVSRSPPPF